MADIIPFRTTAGYFEAAMIEASTHHCRGSVFTMAAMTGGGEDALISAIREAEQALFHLIRAAGVPNADRALFQLLNERRNGTAMTQTVDSTADARTTNNVLRHEYRILSDAEKATMKALKDKGAEFLALIEEAGQSRELSLAKTKVEEAVMWAVKHVTA